jgi:C4-dicarboxylate transporter, DctM subunit
MVVWVGDAMVYEPKVEADGARLTFKTPQTRTGATLDLGVGRADPFGEEVVQRTVAPGAYRTTGLSRSWVAAIGAGIALLALLGAPLFVVIASVTLLGWFLETQLRSDVGFFVSPGGKAGLATDVFISWLGPMGDSPLFIAIPLFTFAGTLMSESRTPTRIIALCRALLGWMPGGLALVALVACSFFTAFTGASGVTIIALGGLLYPILLKEKYPDRFSIGLLTTCGSLGLLFPPSLPVIVYGLVARVDVGRLFQAALIPGFVLVGALFSTSFVAALASGVPRHRFVLGDVGRALRAAAWEVPLPILVVGGIYLGIVTAAEASAVTAFYVLFMTCVVHREIGPRQLPGVVRRTAILVGAILLIMGAALGFTTWLTTEQIPQKILAAMQEHITDQRTFLLALNLFLLVVGCLMDVFSATLVVVPLIVPVALEFGVDPYLLAVIFLINLEIGYSTPPVGINLFLASLRFRRPVVEMYRASALFIVVMFAVLLVITYVPSITLGVFDGLPLIEVPAPRLEVKQGEEQKVEAKVSLGGVLLAEAKARADAAKEALAHEEARLRVSWSDLEEAVRKAERALDTAASPVARAAAEQTLRDARAAAKPLAPAAAKLDQARRLVADLEQLAQTVKWRSRKDGTEATGPAFSTANLAPGEHLVAATARDKRGHVSQVTFVVNVAAPPPGEEKKEEGWGWDPGTDTAAPPPASDTPGTEKR